MSISTKPTIMKLLSSSYITLVILILYITIAISRMTKTKEQNKNELKFVLDNVLCIHVVSILPTSLSNAALVLVDQLLSLTFKEIQDLSYKDDQDAK